MLQTRFLRRESRLTEAAKTCRSAVEHRAPPDEITTCNRAILAYVSPR